MAWAFMSGKAESRLPGRGGESLRARALRFLARREHSRAELRRKLALRAAEGEDLDALLDDLAKRGWLSDARFAEHAARAKSGRFGPRKLAYYLKSRGLDDEVIAQGIRNAGIDGAPSLERVWGSRFRAPPADERERLRQVRFLQGRGFEVEVIFKFLKSLGEKP